MSDRDDLYQSRYARFDLRGTSEGDGLDMDGYAAVFNADTVIEDAQGAYVERIAPGAFKRSLGQRMPVLQFDHGGHPLIGSLPLGVIRSIREDGHGLRVKARLSGNWLVSPVADAIRSGAVDGMSFRFRVLHDEWSDDGADGMQVRTLLEVELAEVGPVVFPAYPQTSVGVRCDNALADATVSAIRSRMLTAEAATADDEGEALTPEDFRDAPAEAGTASRLAPPVEGTPDDDASPDRHALTTNQRRARDLAFMRDTMALVIRKG